GAPEAGAVRRAAPAPRAGYHPDPTASTRVFTTAVPASVPGGVSDAYVANRAALGHAPAWLVPPHVCGRAAQPAAQAPRAGAAGLPRAAPRRTPVAPARRLPALARDQGRPSAHQPAPTAAHREADAPGGRHLRACRGPSPALGE